MRCKKRGKLVDYVISLRSSSKRVRGKRNLESEFYASLRTVNSAVFPGRNETQRPIKIFPSHIWEKLQKPLLQQSIPRFNVSWKRVPSQRRQRSPKFLFNCLPFLCGSWLNIQVVPCSSTKIVTKIVAAIDTGYADTWPSSWSCPPVDTRRHMILDGRLDEGEVKIGNLGFFDRWKLILLVIYIYFYMV